MKSSNANVKESVSPARAGSKSVTVRGRVKMLEHGQEKPVKRSAASKKLEVKEKSELESVTQSILSPKLGGSQN